MAETAESSSSNTETQKIATEAAEEELKKLTIGERKVKLRTADDVTFEVEAWIAKEMPPVQSFIDDADDLDTVIPLHNVYGQELSRIVDYLTEHRGVAGNVKAEREFDERYTAELSVMEMKELVLAANYLDIKILLDSLTRSIADAIKNKSVEFVREFFGIVNDYEPEEEAQYRETNAWAFQNIVDDDN